MIETERLILRVPKLEDLDRWAEFMADPVATRYLGGVQPRNMAWRSLMTAVGAWTLTGVSAFSVIERSGRWVGRVGPWQPDGWPGTEVGWGLHPDSQGKGYAIEAASAAMDYAFNVLGWQDVIHCIDPNNAPSQALASKLGSTLRGPTQMPAPYDQEPCEIWGQTAAQWRQRAL